GGADVLAHYSNIVGDGYRTLFENQKVRYDLDLADGPNGPAALNISVID
ncbi:MAG: cold shock domain-containing protein, partial [Chloroflexota bacterium]